jgi:serine/threonine protein kinase
VLGSGGYGDVLAAIHKKTNRQLACKVVDLTRCVKKTRKQPLHDVTNSSPVARRDKSGITRDSILDSQQFREFDILQDLDHPNIVHLEKVFWSESTLFIFQELITGGDLFSYVIYREVRLLDPEVAVILMQILKGVEYLHDCDIVHRDLKPDNILISTSTDAPLRIIITDFGGCRRLESNNTPERSSNIPQKRMHTFVGTTGYFAPFVL